MRVAIVGASGFIGSAATEAFQDAGHKVTAIAAPRFRTIASTPAEITRASNAVELDELVHQCRGHDVVINASGIPVATSGDRQALYGANSLTPYVVWLAARDAGAERFIHVSSAVVQGRTPVLDGSSRYDPESPYAASKVLAEQSLLADMDGRIVVYRPTSVHGGERDVTQRLQRLASSAFSMVAAPGSDPTPQIHVRQAGRALLVLADLAASPPAVVLHPWEGFTTKSFLTELSGGRKPRTIPRWLARAAVMGAFLAAKVLRRGAWGHARRLEMLFFGQRQSEGWLEAADPSLSYPHPGWSENP